MNYKWCISILIVTVLAPLYTLAQYKLTGVLRDSADHTIMPGVNVVIEGQNKSTNTDESGEFEIESRTGAANVTFSFIGYKTVTRKVIADTRAVIEMNIDPAESQDPAFIRTTFGLGYYADPHYEPFGIILTNHLQSIGNTKLGITSIFKIWQREYNFEASINKELDGRIRRIMDNFFVGYKSIDSPQELFKMKQVRGLVSRAIEPVFGSIDLGAAYNEVSTTNEQGSVRQYYVSATFGATKVFGQFLNPILSGWGFHGNVNYHPDRTMFEVGTFKSITLRKFPSMELMAKYYNYQEIDGWVLSLRFGLFSSAYYCCYSYHAHQSQIATIR